MLAEFFAREGFPTEVVSPDQLEYRNGVLRRGEFAIDMVYRRIKLQEFLVRFDLSHPLVRAYKDRAVCMVNSFRSELGAKKALFDLLTDDAVTAKFPAAEERGHQGFHSLDARGAGGQDHAIKNHTVDLPDFVMKHRAKLVLKPNDDSAELQLVPRRATPTIWAGRKLCARPCARPTWCRKWPSRRARCSR